MHCFPHFSAIIISNLLHLCLQETPGMRTAQWKDAMSVLGAKYNMGARGLLPAILLRREKMLLMHMGIPGALRCCDSR